MVGGVEFEGGEMRVIYGPLHGPFAAYVLGCFAYGFYVLHSTYRQATGLLRLQTKYLLIAMAVPTALAVVTNVVIPFTLGTSRYSKYGPLFSFIMLGLIGHAIIRHRFMDIRVVVKQGVVYLAAFVVAGVASSCLLLVASNLDLPLTSSGSAPLEIAPGARGRGAVPPAQDADPAGVRSLSLPGAVRLPAHHPRDQPGAQQHDRAARDPGVRRRRDPGRLQAGVDRGLPARRGRGAARAGMVATAGDTAPPNLALASPLADRAAAMQALVFRDELAGQDEAAEVRCAR